MNIGFYDPISERWIKPRPEKPVEAVDPVSLGEALLNAIAADALKKRNDKIWQYLKQSAEGCNAATVLEPEPVEATTVLTITKPGWMVYIPPLIVTADPPEYEPELSPGHILYGPAEPEYEAVESLGYIYWKPKD